MNIIRSCEHCKYGPAIFECLLGKTGKKKFWAPEFHNIDDLKYWARDDPSPLFGLRPTVFYHDDYWHNHMPCFEPKTKTTEEKSVGTYSPPAGSYKKTLLLITLLIVVAIAATYALFWFISQ